MDAVQDVPDGPMKVDGEDVGQVVVVGRVNGKSATATNVLYTVDDGTGTIDAKKFMDTEAEDASLDPIVYLR
jgi:replication factor A2